MRSRCIGLIKTQNFVCGVAFQKVAPQGVTHTILNRIFSSKFMTFFKLLYKLVSDKGLDQWLVVFPGRTLGVIHPYGVGFL